MLQEIHFLSTMIYLTFMISRKTDKHMSKKWLLLRTFSQSPCTALAAGNLSAVGAVKVDCHWSLENGKNSHRLHESAVHHNLPIIQCTLGVPQSIFSLSNYIIGNTNQLNTISHTPLVNSPTATKLGLCSCLVVYLNTHLCVPVQYLIWSNAKLVTSVN